MGDIMISCGEKTETDTERDISEAIGALADGWQLRSTAREDIFDWVVKGGRPKSNGLGKSGSITPRLRLYRQKVLWNR
jgi:hypothetical protein